MYMQEDYGVDWDSPNGIEHETVQVPDTQPPLSTAQLDALRSAINPMALDEGALDHGIGLYTAARAFVYAV